MNPGPSVSSSVCPSVRPKSSHTSRHRIFLIFCNKLAFYECRKVTKPDFRKKIIWAKMGQLGPKRGQDEVLGHFHVQNTLVFADFAYYDSALWYLVASAGQSAGKKCWP